MALGTVTLVKKTVFGDLQTWIVDVLPSSGANYTTNGETFTAAQLPGQGAASGGTIQAVFGTAGVLQGSASPVIVWNQTTSKLMAFGTAGSASGLTEIANNTDLSTRPVRLVVLVK